MWREIALETEINDAGWSICPNRTRDSKARCNEDIYRSLG
jgi:hypothetical protein